MEKQLAQMKADETAREQAQVEARAKAKADQAKPKSDDGRAVLTKAIKMADAAREREAAAAEAELASKWAAYVALLQRAGSPKKTDATELSALMVELEISAEQVEQDLKLIAKYGELRARHADREAAHARWVKASTHARELEARLYEELGAARREAGLAQHEHSTASQAHFDLHLLQRGRPQLFKGEIGEQYRSDAPVPELLSSTPTP